jgi:thioredoxin 1
MAVTEVNAGNWNDEVMKAKDLVVVNFWHERCPWCNRLGPIYEQLSDEYEEKIRFTRMDVLESEENKALAIKYGLMGTPTLVFFCNGKSISSNAGFFPKEKLKSVIDDLVGRYRNCVDQSSDINYI